MVLRCFYRLYRPSCNSEERPRSLLWTFGVLVCRVVYVNAVLPINPHRSCWITDNYPIEHTVLEYAIVGSNGVEYPPILFKRRILGVDVRFY